jgi:uncharacterized protein (TIGR02679 family)
VSTPAQGPTSGAGPGSEPGSGQAALPPAARDYLSSPALAPMWSAVRDRLERNGLAARGTVTVTVDDAGAEMLAGLLRAPVSGGEVKVRLDRLDAALRGSVAARGLLSVTELLHGRLVDRKARRQQQATQTATVWAYLEEQLTAVGLAGSDWVGEWTAGIRRAGLLARAGAEVEVVIRHSCAVLAELAPMLSSDSADVGALLPRWELAQLASQVTGSAHGLDDGTAAAALVLRAAAAATGQPVPATAAARRELWARVGVSPDAVSGTVLGWGIRPPGPGPWAAMMRTRANLGLVTHVTLQEWRAAAAATAWGAPGDRVWLCENPQVLQAAAAAAVPGPLLCVGGNPSTVGVLTIDALIAAGVEVRYHGDFDVAGVAIAARLHSRGVLPWRMAAADYLTAVEARSRSTLPALNGSVTKTPWDPELTTVMNTHRVAVHEEAILDTLLGDLL